MTPTPQLAKKWTCDGCGVTVSHVGGGPMPLPGAWADSVEGRFCLICRRERAAEAALGSAPQDSPVGARAKLRRAALIEFEVSRTPEESDGTIARACRTSVTVVTQARRRLRLPDPPMNAGTSRTKKRASASRS
jgi:hypothetical protein